MNDPLPSGDDPRLNYLRQTDGAIEFEYFDMPGGAIINLVNQTTGVRIESGGSVLFSGGSGKDAIDIEETGASAGSYYLVALDAAGNATIAQTVEFTIAHER